MELNKNRSELRRQHRPPLPPTNTRTRRRGQRFYDFIDPQGREPEDGTHTPRRGEETIGHGQMEQIRQRMETKFYKKNTWKIRKQEGTLHRERLPRNLGENPRGQATPVHRAGRKSQPQGQSPDTPRGRCRHTPRSHHPRERLRPWHHLLHPPADHRPHPRRPAPNQGRRKQECPSNLSHLRPQDLRREARQWPLPLLAPPRPQGHHPRAALAEPQGEQLHRPPILRPRPQPAEGAEEGQGIRAHIHRRLPGDIPRGALTPLPHLPLRSRRRRKSDRPSSSTSTPPISRCAAPRPSPCSQPPSCNICRAR